jgi:hypothetical protein
MVSSAVTTICGSFRKEQLLQPDGSNFSQWSSLLREVGITHLTGADFFFTRCSNLSFERGVLLGSIHPSLVSNLQDLKSAHTMYESVKTKFQNVSRAAQMNIWY